MKKIVTKKFVNSVKFGFFLFMMSILLQPSGAVALDAKFFRIVSGSAGGTYYPISGLIANSISSPPGARPCDKGGPCGVPGLIAIAQSSNGGAANVTAVESGQAEGGLAPSDLLYWAYNSKGPYSDKPASKKLRVIANLFPEHVHIVAPKNSKIASLKDLKGKKIGIGLPGSGTQVAVLEILKQFGITRDNFKEAELNISQSVERVQDGSLDAFFYIAGTPAAGIAQLDSTKGMTLIGLSEMEQETALKAVPFYYKADIKKGTYEGVKTNIPTLGVGTQLITNVDQPDELIYGITKALWSETTRKLLDNGHAKGKMIQLENALNGIKLPLHPGAERFYREIGMLK